MKSTKRVEKLSWIMHKFVRNDLSKGTVIFSEESRRAIYEMSNMEFIELKQTLATIQCFFLPKAVITRRECVLMWCLVLT